MTAKEYLKQYETATKRANRYKTEYEHESELVDSVRSTLGGDGQPHGTGVSKAVENRAIRLSDKLWEEVCVIVHLSWNGTHKTHRRALAIVQERIDKRA